MGRISYTICDVLFSKVFLGQDTGTLKFLIAPGREYQVKVDNDTIWSSHLLTATYPSPPSQFEFVTSTDEYFTADCCPPLGFLNFEENPIRDYEMCYTVEY